MKRRLNSQKGSLSDAQTYAKTFWQFHFNRSMEILTFSSGNCNGPAWDLHYGIILIECDGNHVKLPQKAPVFVEDSIVGDLAETLQ